MEIKLPTNFGRISAIDMQKRIKLVTAMSSILKKCGFSYTDVPRVYLSSSVPEGGGLKCVDREGETLTVVDNLVYALLCAAETDLSRLCGYGEIYKFKGKPVNRPCFSAIISGFSGAEAEAEIITSGLELLGNLGVETKVRIGHPGVMAGIAENYLNCTLTAAELRNILNTPPKTEAEAGLYKLLKDAEAVNGKLEALSEYASKIANEKSLGAVRALLDLGEALTAIGLEDKIIYDLSVMGEDCENIAFEFRDASGNALATGGRYDFGKGDVCRCVGFTIDPDKLLSLYPMKDFVEEYDAVIGVATGIIPLQTAYRLRKGLLESSLSVRLLYKTGKEETFAYAKAFDILTAVYVDENGAVQYNE